MISQLRGDGCHQNKHLGATVSGFHGDAFKPAGAPFVQRSGLLDRQRVGGLCWGPESTGADILQSLRGPAGTAVMMERRLVQHLPGRANPPGEVPAQGELAAPGKETDVGQERGWGKGPSTLKGGSRQAGFLEEAGSTLKGK